MENSATSPLGIRNGVEETKNGLLSKYIKHKRNPTGKHCIIVGIEFPL